MSSSCSHKMRKLFATLFCCCCKKQQEKFLRGFSMSSELSSEQYRADYVKLFKLYFNKENMLLAADYEGNITFVRILRENPRIIIHNGDKYESHILELARLREDLVSVRDSIQTICEETVEPDPPIKSADEFDSEEGITRESQAQRDSSTLFADPDLGESRFKLSKMWSQKLKESKNTIRPKWPDYLPVVKFEVVKVNKVGQRLRRIITLTQQSILNAKADTGELKKVYMYNDVALAGLIDDDTFVLRMKNGHQIHFTSNDSAHIVQQIMSRLKYRLRLDRATLQATDTTTKQIIHQIAYENAMGHDAYITFAEELKQLFISSIKDSDLLTIHKGSDQLNATHNESILNPMSSSRGNNDKNYSQNNSGHNSVELTSLNLGTPGIEDESRPTELASHSRIRTSSSSSVDLKRRGTARSSTDALKAVHQMYKEGSWEHQTQTAVRQLLSGRNSTEGALRLQFITNFNSDTQSSIMNAKSVKSFNDFKLNMFEHILKHRGKQLSSFISGNPAIIRDEDDIFDVSFVNDIDDENLCNLSLIVYNIIEASLLDSILEQSFLNYKNIPEILKDEKELLLRIQVFSHRDQKASNIEYEFHSPLGWKSAIFELSNLETRLCPWEMLNTLIRTSKSIYSEYKHAIAGKNGSVSRPMGADDIVPIFIYVFCQSQISRPVIAKEIMWHLSHPSLLHGECGYYLTIYDSCIQFLLNEEMSASEIEIYDNLKSIKA